MLFLYSFRIKAFLLHLCFSLFIASMSVLLVFFVWYPAPLQKAIGVTHIYFIMLAIDVILGPILTFILAKKDKKGLKFDLTIVLLLQLGALSYGLYHIGISRPVWIAFDNIRFDVVQANDVEATHINKALPIYQKASWLGPKYVAIRKAKNYKEKNDWLFYELSTGVSPSMRPQFYEPIDNAWLQINLQQNNFSKLESINSINKINKVLNEYPSATGWLPLKAYENSMVVLVDINSRKILAIVDLQPW